MSDKCTRCGSFLMPRNEEGWCEECARDTDPINHPPHYTQGTLEVIDAIEGMGLGFHEGNIVKYISRAGHKGSALEDLKKAAWYLDRLIKREEKKK